jgi:hypothetical protein
MQVIYHTKFDKRNCKLNPNSLFVFGDNAEGWGKKGQAIIRDEPNTSGIITKLYPSMAQSSMFMDNSKCLFKMLKSIIQMEKDSVIYEHVVFPTNCWGSGLSKMQAHSPKLFKRLFLYHQSFKYKSYQSKDIQKFVVCNKMITRGGVSSSSDKYQYTYEPTHEINVKRYHKYDIVGVSVNGRRSNRISFDKHLINLAIKAGVTFVCDNEDNRNRRYNIGEQEFARYIKERGYKQVANNQFRAVFKK